MESANDQNFFNMGSNNNFEYGTTPMMMDPSYDVGLQQNAMSTGWLMNDSFYGYEQTVTRQEYLDLAQRVTTLGEQVTSLAESLKNLKDHNKRVAPFLNELRDLVKYVVHKDDPQVTVRTPQKEDFGDVEIVVDSAGQQPMK